MRVIEQHATRLIEEIRRSLEYYQAQQDALPLGRVVVLGAGARLPRFVERLGTALHVPIEDGHPLSHVSVGKLRLAPAELDQIARQVLECSMFFILTLLLSPMTSRTLTPTKNCFWQRAERFARCRLAMMKLFIFAH